MNFFDKLLEDIRIDIEHSNSIKDLLNLKAKFLGRNSLLAKETKKIVILPLKERALQGKNINKTKQIIQNLILEKKNEIEKKELIDKMSASYFDITLPGRGGLIGSLHPITIVYYRITAIFKNLGFSISSGNEIESEYYNFTALNIPEYHPARNSQDTFYISDNILLRTHMSPVQVHFMEKNKPPFSMVAPGKVYRSDFDVSHTPMFHQIEGLRVGKNINFLQLKNILSIFLELFFEHNCEIRFRPSYFPFTEPSAEVDMKCFICNGKGCQTCGNSGWIEILGCGMIHPNVLNNIKIDYKKFSGYAFGIGIDRLAMLYYGVSDIRLFFENDIRFLEQF